jgi:DNA repair exonuclease SbcCD ATPase subunit
MTTKKPVIMLDNKYYASYENENVEEAKKRARQLKDKGKKVTLRYKTIEEIEKLEKELEDKLNELKKLKKELEEEKKYMSDDIFTWGKANLGSIRKINTLESQIKVLKTEI